MTTYLGQAKLDSNVRVNQLTTDVVWDYIMTAVSVWNMESAKSLSAFTNGKKIEKAQAYFVHPGSSIMPENAPGTQPSPIDSSGGYTVAFPIKQYANQFARNFVVNAYMTMEELDRGLSNMLIGASAGLRKNILKSLLNNTNPPAFVDTLLNAGTIQPLPIANGDSVTYPRWDGSGTLSTADNFLVSGYAANAISNTNNPYKTMSDRLKLYNMGDGVGRKVFINSAQVAVTEALTSFVKVADPRIAYGVNTDLVAVSGDVNAPGTLIGVIDSNCLVYEWPTMPANYMTMVWGGMDAPLAMRTDTADSGLPQGELFFQPTQGAYITGEDAYYRYGIAAYNRVAACSMFLDAGAVWSIPSGYAWDA